MPKIDKHETAEAIQGKTGKEVMNGLLVVPKFRYPGRKLDSEK